MGVSCAKIFVIYQHCKINQIASKLVSAVDIDLRLKTPKIASVCQVMQRLEMVIICSQKEMLIIQKHSVSSVNVYFSNQG